MRGRRYRTLAALGASFVVNQWNARQCQKWQHLDVACHIYYTSTHIYIKSHIFIRKNTIVVCALWLCSINQIMHFKVSAFICSIFCVAKFDTDFSWRLCWFYRYKFYSDKSVQSLDLLPTAASLIRTVWLLMGPEWHVKYIFCQSVRGDPSLNTASVHL